MCDVFANGAQVLAAYDSAAKVGGKPRIVEESFVRTTNEGMGTLGFSPLKGPAIVSAVEVVRQL